MIREIARFIVGGRMRFTAVACDGVAIGQEEFSRFEGRVAQVHTPGKRDPEETVVVRLEKPIPDKYNFKRRGRIYMYPSSRKWFALTKDDKEVIFRPELVGVCYIAERHRMEKFGFVIAGEDIRRALFRALYDSEKDRERQPLTIMQAVDKKGDKLCAYTQSVLTEHGEWFTPEERTLIEEYLRTR